MKNPKARNENLVIQELPGETLVYDLDASQAHCLNKTAAFVWKHCDGKNSVADIGGLIEQDFGQSVKDDFVWLAIDLLNGKNLLAEKTFDHLPNRREMIKSIGFASVVALPIVATLAVPATASDMSANCACVNPGDCNSQFGCPNLVNCNGSGICAP